MTEQEIKLIEYLARGGEKLSEIPKRLGIKKSVWKRYLKENKGEKRRLELLRCTTDFMVEDALLKRALGYRCEEYKETEKPNGTEYATTNKDVPPDVRAAALWLKLRCREAWDEGFLKTDDGNIERILSELDREAQNEDE
ncbi:MAG: hypothetical protein Q4B31_02880 [Clostridia bacterium]|nr:hypothetical protein [Clostridia bacterium]